MFSNSVPFRSVGSSFLMSDINSCTKELLAVARIHICVMGYILGIAATSPNDSVVLETTDNSGQILFQNHSQFFNIKK